ncbi:MAG: hypothetical protein V4596_01245 [Bdellovibrionota bacterium]
MNKFIYMDIYRCGKVARVAVNSFVKHYPDLELHLFGVADDFLWLEDMSSKGRLVFQDISSDSALLRRWDVHGHWGTAHLWAKLIQTRSEKFLLHLDSDIIFRGPALDPIFKAIDEGFDLVGSPRNYKNNLNKRDDIRYLPDLVQTAIFAFNRELVSQHEFEELVEMARGHYNPLGHPVIDFFDPVMFEILKNGGNICYLDVDDFGGTHREGHRNNRHTELNNTLGDLGTLFCHYSSVGSGLKYFHDPLTRVFTPKFYVQHGLMRYWSFCKFFYNQDLPVNTDKQKFEKVYEKYKSEMSIGVDLKAIQNDVDWMKLEKKYNPNLLGNLKTSLGILAEVNKKISKKLKNKMRASS